MNDSNRKRVLGGKWLALVTLLVACGGVTSVPTVGGESHFLRDCDMSCGPGLECISNLCTRGCVVGKDSCTDLAPAAECTAASIEPGAVAVCDYACSNADDCRKLGGTTWTCAEGFCREPPLRGDDPTPGGAGSSGSAGTGGTLNAGGSGAGPKPWQPPELCSLPFEAGTCPGQGTVFAMIDGECRSAFYSGCEGNENRFNSLEECLRVCQGMPQANPCPEGRVEQQLCLECGPAGGCFPVEEVCGLPCTDDEVCQNTSRRGLTCRDGFCQVSAGCY